MTEKRDISTSTTISICIPGEYILIKDLQNKPHIFPISELEKIGAKIVELASNRDLPFSDLGRATITDNESHIEAGAEGFDFDISDLSGDNIKKELIKGAFAFLKGAGDYPRGKSVKRPPAKK